MAEFIKIYEDKPSEAAIKKVVDVLKSGGLVIYPTDTVYGLGCDITNNKALERIAKIKGIKLEKAKEVLGKVAKVINSRPTFECMVEGHTDNVPFTGNTIALDIVRMLGNPIVSTSIHDDDEVLEYSTDPELIFEKWQYLVDLVIDGGYGDNIGSTIIDLSGYEPVVIREGKGDPDIF